MAVLVIYIGLAPGLTLKVIGPSVDRMLQLYKSKTEHTAQVERNTTLRPDVLALAETQPTGKGE